MQKRSVQRGRPRGTTTYDEVPAKAFGAAVRAARTAQGVAQEALAARVGVERSHMGKIERGEHLPNLGLVLKIAVALECSAAELVEATEANLPKGWFTPNRDA
jgi:transcriptional regulator with XRE-family HTH domain